MDYEKNIWRKKKWDLWKDVTCSFELILEAAPEKSTAVGPISSHLTNYPWKANKSRWEQPSRVGLCNTPTVYQQRDKTLPQRVFCICLKTIWWWGSSKASALGNAEYFFTVIVPRSTLTWRGWVTLLIRGQSKKFIDHKDKNLPGWIFKAWT